MAKRQIVLSEEFGVYRLEAEGGAIVVTGKNAEDVLLKALRRRDTVGVPATSFEAGEVLEEILGRGSTGGTIESAVHA